MTECHQNPMTWCANISIKCMNVHHIHEFVYEQNEYNCFKDEDNYLFDRNQQGA